MANSVSNDALWEKMSEIEEKIEMRKTSDSTQEQVDISSELKTNRDELVDIFKRCIQGLGTHCDSHFKVIHENAKLSNELTKDGFQILSYMWAWMQEKEKEREKMEKEQVRPTSVQEADNSCLNLKFFKVMKTYLVITILSLLVFILTVFSMKQQNDHSLLLDKYYKQDVVIRDVQTEVDSLKNMLPNQNKKKNDFGKNQTHK